MWSLHQLSLTGTAFLFTALLHVQGASMRQHRLRSGGELDDRPPNPAFVPNYDMVKALEYIESLRQQTGREEELAEDYDDADRSLYLPRLEQLQSQNQERGDVAEWQDRRTQQWLKALLRNLQKQGGREPGEVPAASASRYAQRNRQYARPEDSPATGEIADYGGNPKPHKKYPLMFEDETEPAENPNKRANEHAEEQYSPQSLATLQSVFEELGKLSTVKNQNQKRKNLEERFYRGDDDGNDEDDDLNRLRSLAYEDVTGGEDWTPIEENVETEEEVKGSREMIDRDLDEDDLKRSTSPMYGDKEDQDDINRLVDYYLLKILEKTERTEEKRDRDQGWRAEKRLQRPSYNVDPMAFYQLMEISRKLQIQPEDLIEMVRNGELRKQDQTQDEEELEAAENLVPEEGLAFRNKDKLYGRRMPDRLANDLPDDLTSEDILNILGLESSNGQNAKYFLKQGQPRAMPSRYPIAGARRGNYFPPRPKATEKRADDYDDAIDEDELATFLAAQMLAQYPEVMNKPEQRRSSQRNGQEPLAYGIPEQVLKDYIDQMDSKKTTAVKRQAETEAVDDSTQTQKLDDVTLPNTTTLQKPEAETKEETELTGKTIIGM